MNLIEAIFVIVGEAAASLTVIGTFTWWVYRCGRASGKAKAKWETSQQSQAEMMKEVRMFEARIGTLEAQLGAVQAELDSLRPKRRRA